MYLNINDDVLVIEFEEKDNKKFIAPLLPVINIIASKFCINLTVELDLVLKARWAGISWVQFFLFYKSYFDNYISNVTYYLGVLDDLGTILDLKSLLVYNAKSNFAYFGLFTDSENVYMPDFIQFNLNVVSSYFGASLLQTAQSEDFLLEIFLTNLFRLYLEDYLKLH